MKIAVEGCCHGELKNIYRKLGQIETERKIKADLLLICGDFQAVRNEYDLRNLACPPKYRKMGDFQDYYNGKEKAPVLTIFIGGNHEASNHLFDLYHGGWVCPNIYFLGFSGLIRYGGLRIGGLSGIFNDRHYDIGYYERHPYEGSSLKSIYHYRRMEIFKLSHLKPGSLDIFLSHEWPTGIYNYGDKESLLKIKPYFKAEVDRNELGAKPLEELMYRLKPKNWFSGHMHVHFEAKVPHPDGSGTNFMALDKCLPRRTFLEIIDVPDDGSRNLCYDPEWLGIVKAANALLNFASTHTKLPSRLEFEVPVEEPPKPIPFNFKRHPPTAPSNPQTDEFCGLLGISNLFSKTSLSNRATKQQQSGHQDGNPEEIQLEL